MKRNLILNIATLVTTSLLLVFLVMAWYISNEQVSVTGIQGSTADDAFQLTLERGTYDSYHQSWEWESTSSLAISEMIPGKSFFFRFKITAAKAGTMKASLKSIESNVQADIIDRISEIEYIDGENVNKYYVTVNGAKKYEMNSGGTEVDIVGSSDTSLGTLYTYDDGYFETAIAEADFVRNGTLFTKEGNNYVAVTSGSYDPEEHYYTHGKFTLGNFLVENTFKFYDYGSGTQNFYMPGTTTFYDDDVNNDADIKANSTLIKNVNALYNIPAAGVRYGYFALEFNEELSEETYKHLDGLLKKDSNLYESQILSIRRISVEEA